MVLRRSLLALSLFTVLPSAVVHAAPAEVTAAEAPLQRAKDLEAAGRFGEAWEIVSAALEAAAAADRGALEDARARLSEKTGFLSLRVDPEGAEVFVDGASVGLAPVAALRRVTIGTHEVRVVKAGHETFLRSVSVGPDGKAVVSAVLVRESAVGTLRVRDADGQPIHVVIDGVDVGATPLERDVAPGLHKVAGAGIDRSAPEQEIDVPRGRTVDLELRSRPLAATLRIRTKDGKGVVRLDGAVVGEGTYEGQVRLGVHRVEVTHEGQQPWRREVVLHDQEVFEQEVLLEAPPTAALVDDGYVAPNSGWYGSFGFLGTLAPKGAGSEPEIGCLGLGAYACTMSKPIGGGLTGTIGYDFDPVGFELRMAGLSDYYAGKASFDGNVLAAGGVSAAAPARTESFTFVRAGALASLQVRATAKTSAVSFTGAVGAGASYRWGFLYRKAEIDDPALASLGKVPEANIEKVLSPAVTADLGIGFRIGSTSWLMVSVVGILETAGNDFRSRPGDSLATDLVAGALPAGVDPNALPKLPSASYHYASGPQYTVGPELSFRFGP
jgi:hypothetical protein